MVVLSHEGKHSRSGETRIIKKINQVNEHIKIPYDNKIADVSVAMQRQESLDADLLKGLRFDGSDSEYSGQQYSCLILAAEALGTVELDDFEHTHLSGSLPRRAPI